MRSGRPGAQQVPGFQTSLLLNVLSFQLEQVLSKKLEEVEGNQHILTVQTSSRSLSKMGSALTFASNVSLQVKYPATRTRLSWSWRTAGPRPRPGGPWPA